MKERAHVGPDELLLPRGSMLLAAVLHVRQASDLTGGDLSFLAATSHQAVVIRSRTGSCRWDSRNADSTTVLPPDWGAEIFAMVDIAHLTDWLQTDSIACPPDGAFSGTSEHLGDYVAHAHPTFRFVTSVVAYHSDALRPVSHMMTYRVVKTDEALLDAPEVDPRTLMSRLRSGLPTPGADDATP